MPVSLTRLVDDLLADAFAGGGLPIEGARAARAARPELADLQCNGAMALGKALGRNPRDIAAGIADRLRGQAAFTEVSVAGPGFINLRLRAAARHGLSCPTIAALADVVAQRAGVPAPRVP